MVIPYDVCASRTNLTSDRVTVHKHEEVGEGMFRIAYAGTYIGGNRNQQEAVCKKFKSKYGLIENEFYANDMKVADRAIRIALDWNQMCQSGHEILITKGTVQTIRGKKYLVEPLIRYFTKFTSNNGWIATSGAETWEIEVMEAFCHYTYHRSGGSLIVCDLQGRYRNDWRNVERCRFELTDPAICSRNRKYGPTDMGLKGIESFFHNHVCNEYCNWDGHWQRPLETKKWFPRSSGTSMLASTEDYKLTMDYRTTFQPGFMDILEEDDEEDY